MQRDHEVRIVTISREFGSGGSDLARMLGERLGWRVIDRSLIEEVARRLGAPPEEIASLDEHVGGIVERLGSVFVRGTPELPAPPPHPDALEIAEVARAVIRDAANDPPIVVVGHGGQCLFRGRPDALHVRLVGPLEERVRRAAERLGLPPRAAEARARRADEDRHRYIRHHFHSDWNDPHLYDVALDTGGVGLEEAVELLRGMIERRAGRAAAGPADEE
jgi:cytidylate kinase